MHGVSKSDGLQISVGAPGTANRSRPVVELRLSLSLPPTSNHRLTPARHRRGLVMTKRSRDWRALALQEIVLQAGGRYLTGEYEIVTTVTRPDRRQRDIENYPKHIGDALQEAGVVINDALCHSSTVRWSLAKPMRSAKLHILLTAHTPE